MTATAQDTTLAYRVMQVAGVERLTPHMLRIRFSGADLHDVRGAAPDQYIKLFLPLEGQARPQLPPPLAAEDEVVSWYRRYLAMPDEVRPPMRTYTIRALRQELGELDIDFVLHPDAGPASNWARSAAPGDEVAFLGPHGLYSVPRDTRWQLLVGDESALPAIGAILDALPQGERARVFAEVTGPTAELRLRSHADIDITWVHRGTAEHGAAVLEAVRAAAFPQGPAYAWVAGEASLVKHVRRHLVRERGVDRRAVTFTGYWRRGVSEDDQGRESMRKIDAGEVAEEEF
ncbi:NADPH-dependent ferric siderophore reductase, contains FAD-binding and SIP domains [Amycolatopsis marina]|uniref:NADPH-dependent ferric siderophore reductase, contains FAD-binding and SIP domains n=1 Tax=Amycolatopsis marina TaxID=490629 RepID=A0A1I1BNS5_9PSEU|nr:siderophore-interacting protein [Amycolatopsis marina]SFB51296.1 NADPH-dependent ferric siderophore reductase, contains FAD-binding and SIP domains [Amycolatopsis marina]